MNIPVRAEGMPLAKCGVEAGNKHNPESLPAVSPAACLRQAGRRAGRG